MVEAMMSGEPYLDVSPVALLVGATILVALLLLCLVVETIKGSHRPR